jgi:hypothetical protein
MMPVEVDGIGSRTVLVISENCLNRNGDTLLQPNCHVENKLLVDEELLDDVEDGRV